MPRLTVTISEEHEQLLEEKAAAAGSYRTKDEFVREAIESHQRVEDLSQQLACLEAEVESLRSQREELQRKAARVEELEDKLWDLQMEYQQLIHEETAEMDPEELAAAADAVASDDMTAVDESSVSGGSTAVGESTSEPVPASADETEQVEPQDTPGAGAGAPEGEATGEESESSVYIDRELAVKRPSVSTRLKSAILGGTIGKR